MSPFPRIGRVPLTVKQPEACPYCGSHVLTRRGTRTKKLEIVQLWRCSSCKRVFTPGPEALRNKTYPLRMILSALTDYDTGHTLQETAARLKKKTNRSVSPSTIATWLQLYQRHCSYRRFRAEGLTRFPANQTIRSIKLYHRQVYPYAYHRAKLGLLRDGTLDDKRTASAASTARFAPLADFLENVPTVCPHELFTQEEDVKARASQARPEFADASHAIVTRKENAATETAALIIPAVGNNKLRHETLQRFMLANDSVTLAVEIPIWLTENDITSIEREYGIELAPNGSEKKRGVGDIPSGAHPVAKWHVCVTGGADFGPALAGDAGAGIDRHRSVHQARQDYVGANAVLGILDCDLLRKGDQARLSRLVSYVGVLLPSGERGNGQDHGRHTRATPKSSTRGRAELPSNHFDRSVVENQVELLTEGAEVNCL